MCSCPAPPGVVKECLLPGKWNTLPVAGAATTAREAQMQCRALFDWRLTPPAYESRPSHRASSRSPLVRDAMSLDGPPASFHQVGSELPLV